MNIIKTVELDEHTPVKIEGGKYINIRNMNKEKILKLSQLPKYLLITIALEFSLPDLITFCSLNKNFNNKVCANHDFWLQKLRKDFKFEQVIDKTLAREYYLFLNKHKGKNINTQLIEASKIGYLPIVKYLVEYGGANIHADDDRTLRSASYNGHLEVVKYLVEQGANIHTRDDYALRHASEQGHLEVVKYLVEYEGANIHARDDYALRWASYRGHLEVVKYLVEYGGADIHADNDDALGSASENGYLEVVKYLVGQGANIHADCDYALTWAKYYGHLEVIKYLEGLK